MDRQRYAELELRDGKLTAEEIAQGWHFCPEWDYMLVGPGMPEADCCLCEAPQQKP